jgi:hypothetical protein
VGKVIASAEESSSFWQQRDYKAFSPATDWDNVDWDSGGLGCADGCGWVDGGGGGEGGRHSRRSFSQWQPTPQNYLFGGWGVAATCKAVEGSQNGCLLEHHDWAFNSCWLLVPLKGPARLRSTERN